MSSNAVCGDGLDWDRSMFEGEGTAFSSKRIDSSEI